MFSRGAAVASIVVLSTALAGCSLLNGFIGTDVQGEGESTDIFSIVVGDCVNDGVAEGTISSVPTVPCSEPHDSEVYAAVYLEDQDFPGDDAILNEADTLCLAEFAGFMGVEYEASIADIQYYFPTELTWASGDREVLCLVYETDGAGNSIQTVGSLEGTGR